MNVISGENIIQKMLGQALADTIQFGLNN